MMSCSELVGHCRRKGATLRVDGQGEIVATGLDDELRVTIKAMRSGVVDVLWSEKRLWPVGSSAGESKFFDRLSDLYDLVCDKFLPDFAFMASAGQARAWILELHSACLDGHEKGLAAYRRLAPELLRLLDSIAADAAPGELWGPALRSECLDVFVGGVA